jgi:hypothetical protein
MNKFFYFAPLASFPLMALAQQSADDSMKTDNPYIAAALVFIVSIAVSVALIGYFRLQARGRVATGIVFGVGDWLITAPISISAGVNPYASLAMATLSAGLLAFLVIRFGERGAAFFRRNGAEHFDTDRD